MVSKSNLHHSGRQCRIEKEADMWFLGQMLHAVDFTNPVSCIHRSNSHRMCMQ